VTANNAVQLWADVHAANPHMKLFGSDGRAEDAFTTKIGGAQDDTYLTVPVLPPDKYPPAGRRFFLKFKEQYGHAPAPYAIYGYEAMTTALLAIANAGDDGADRQAVTKAFFAIKRRDSVLGAYSIDPNGDTTLASEGGYRVRNGKQVFDTVLQAKPTG
jgi:branched-chain amino acid transport system substrate-binding protein